MEQHAEHVVLGQLCVVGGIPLPARAVALPIGIIAEFFNLVLPRPIAQGPFCDMKGPFCDIEVRRIEAERGGEVSDRVLVSVRLRLENAPNSLTRYRRDSRQLGLRPALARRGGRPPHALPKPLR